MGRLEVHPAEPLLAGHPQTGHAGQPDEALGATGVFAGNVTDPVQGIRDFYSVNIPAFIVSGDTSKVVKDARPVDNCTLMSKPVNTSHYYGLGGGEN